MHGVDLCPGLSSIERPVAPKEVGSIADAGVAGSYSQTVRGVEEDVLAIVRPAANRALFDPGGIEIGGRPRRFAEYDRPAPARIDGLGNAVVEFLGAFAQFEATKANVRDPPIAASRGNCPKLSGLLAERRASQLPASALVF